MLRTLRDAGDIAFELFSRNLYWRVPGLIRWYRGRPVRPQNIRLRHDIFQAALAEVVKPGQLLLVHASLTGVALELGREVTNGLSTALTVLHDVGMLLGDGGTLAMPTHPLYPEDLITQWGDATGRVLDYSPAETPSSVGLLSELFRRRRGVQRSHHPLSSVACTGPLSADILRDNLAPGALPHGAGSAYARIADLDGVVLSIGRPLIKCMTTLHVAEELRDGDWTAADFFRPRRFRISLDSEVGEWTVRERRPEFVRSLALRQVRRDLLREGILKEGSAGPLRLDFARARDVVGYMSLRNRGNAYPYYFPRTATFLAPHGPCRVETCHAANPR